MKHDIVIIVVGTVLLMLVWVGWTQFQSIRAAPDERSQVFCTADAKLCPDGSYVGRIAPDCRFAQCPGG